MATAPIPQPVAESTAERKNARLNEAIDRAVDGIMRDFEMNSSGVPDAFVRRAIRSRLIEMKLDMEMILL